MSIKLMAEIFESETLGPTQRLIMLALADHADENGHCYPSIGRLSQRTGLKERAIQSNIRKLCDDGFLTLADGGGRGKTNRYFITPNPASDDINPARETVFEMHPRTRNGVSDDINPASDDINPAADAPEPLITINNHQLKNIDARDSALSILSNAASVDASKSFIAWRKKLRKPLTEVAARRLANQLMEISKSGFDPDDALGMAEERGWQTVKADWYLKEKQKGGQNDTTAFDAARSAARLAIGRVD